MRWMQPNDTRMGLMGLVNAAVMEAAPSRFHELVQRHDRVVPR